MFVESEKRSETPRSPASRRRSSSKASPSVGDSSNLKSPVWTTVPASVAMRRAVASAMEWVTRTGSITKLPTLYCSRGRGLVEAGELQDLVLGLPVTHEAERVRRAVDRDVEPLEEVGKRPNVVLMAVGEKDAGDLPRVGLEHPEIGVDDVHPQAATVEGHPAVDDEELATLLEGEDVHPDLSQAAER